MCDCFCAVVLSAVYVVIGLYCLGTFAGLYHVLSPIVALIPGFKKCRCVCVCVKGNLLAF